MFDEFVDNYDDGLHELPGNTNMQYWSKFWFSSGELPSECEIVYHIDYSVNLYYRLVWIAKSILKQDTEQKRVSKFVLSNWKSGKRYNIINTYLPDAWIIDEVRVVSNDDKEK